MATKGPTKKIVDRKLAVRSTEQVDSSPAGPDDTQDMSPEDTEKFWKAIDESNELVLTATIENVDRLIGLVTANLRSYKEATEYLREADAAMYNFEGFASRHRFTLPRAMSYYYERLFKLTHLAEINQMRIADTWPLDSNGKGRTLSPMQQSALWH